MASAGVRKRTGIHRITKKEVTGRPPQVPPCL